MLMAQNKSFFLKFLLSSQTAIVWMVVFFLLSFLTYLLGLKFDSKQKHIVKWAYRFSVVALIMGLTGLLVRWFESYGYNAQMGHIPISNLYESVLLLILISSGLHLYFEEKHKTAHLGAFALLSINIANGFLIWYAVSRQANQITALVPALQSWWMKIHVPANFIGYGAFTLAAMFGIAVLLKIRFPKSTLPNIDVIGEMMYQLISVGFAFFTLATILGAMWAADAWGTYWQWDPKETWALIVWINYAAWLHFRLIYRIEEKVLAYWAILGYFVTLFAYLGVNMFLSGLHSYGQL
jgi:cytochrome c-type biogenesis protein CcsB